MEAYLVRVSPTSINIGTCVRCLELLESGTQVVFSKVSCCPNS